MVELKGVNLKSIFLSKLQVPKMPFFRKIPTIFGKFLAIIAPKGVSPECFAVNKKGTTRVPPVVQRQPVAHFS